MGDYGALIRKSDDLHIARWRLVVLSVYTAIVVATCASLPPKLMTFAEYEKVQFEVSYIVTITGHHGQLIYYGAAHVYDAKHPQIADIQRRWHRFRPTYALNEGGTPPIFSTLEDTVGRNGESALIRWLAKRDGVVVETLDPTRGQLAAAMRGRFTVEQQRVSLVLRQLLLQRQRGGAFRVRDLEAEVARVLGLLDRVRELEGVPNTVSEFRTSVARLLPQLSDWNAVQEHWFDPTVEPPPTWINGLARASNQFRDEFMVGKIEALLRRGERVFAVVGATHVVMQESAIRWGAKQSARMPRQRSVAVLATALPPLYVKTRVHGAAPVCSDTMWGRIRALLKQVWVG